MAYDRAAAVEYARRWAYGRNPAYLDFQLLGGDCTNYASQVLHAGGMPMDYTPVYGWYYIDAARRSAAWTGVEYLYRYLLGADTGKPCAVVARLSEVRLGDIVQLAFEGERYQHSPVVVAVEGETPQEVFVAAHTNDAYRRPLSSYAYTAMRPLHILG